MTPTDLSRSPLCRMRVFLSASIPSPLRARRFRREPESHVWIPEVVILITRAVLSRGGVLVMGGHPTITPLVAHVAVEYAARADVERGDGRSSGSAEAPSAAPILVYQSRAFESNVPHATLLLEKVGVAHIIWTDAATGESLTPEVQLRRPPAPRSVRSMRVRMLSETTPHAMVCVGGMDGVEDEAQMFAQLFAGRPIYTFATTGGAAARLSKMDSLSKVLRQIDTEVLDRARVLEENHPLLEQEAQGHQLRQIGERRSADRESRTDLKRAIYPLAVQTIVDEIGTMRENHSDNPPAVG